MDKIMAQAGQGYNNPPPYSANAPPGPYSPNFPQQQQPQAEYPPQGFSPGPPTQGYPYPQPGYPQGSPQPGYPPSQPGYPPSQPGYPPSQPGYPPSQPGYPQSQPGFAPQSYVPPSYVPPSYVPPNYAPQQQGPIVHQPGPAGPGPQQPGGAWMNMPQGPQNCPPGLEYLSLIDQLLVHQKVEILEALTGFETNNKFTIKNTIGQKVYYAVEDNDCLTRNCCGPMRPFEMKILDNYQNQVINMHRPLACESCCFPCCLQSMEVSSPPGTVIGSIEQEWSLCKPVFSVKNAAGDTVLRIKGPICRFAMCGDIDFQIMSVDGDTVVGKISKQWSGVLREMFTDADYFGITFPMDLDVRMKAVLLGALFLIDAMFFEKAGNRETDGLGML